MKIAYYHFPTIDSTNNFAKINLKLFAQDTLSFITADEQTQGRGRFGNSWISPQGNLYLSVVYFPQKSLSAFRLTQAASLAVCMLLEKLGVQSKIKWPNDLYVNEKKIGGILTEAFSSAYIIGIGLNINMSRDELASLPNTATSLFDQLERTFDIKHILNMVVAELEPMLTELEKAAMLWQEKVSWMVGKHITARGVTKSISGIIISITADGNLTLKDAKGNEHAIQSAEIITD